MWRPNWGSMYCTWSAMICHGMLYIVCWTMPEVCKVKHYIENVDREKHLSISRNARTQHQSVSKLKFAA